MIKTLIPDLPSTAELIPYLEQIDKARWYTNSGPLVRELNEKLSIYLRQPCTVLANGTLALELLLKTKALKGTSVLVPTLSFPATALAALNAGLKVVFGDVDPHTLTLKLTKFKGFKLPVAAFGHPLPSTWQHENNVIVDAAASFGIQPIYHPTVFSLHATKFFGAGEGGVVVADPHTIRRVERLANFGIDNYSSFEPNATNAKLSEYHAAVALADLARLEKKRQKLGELHLKYRQFLGTSVGWQSYMVHGLQTLIIKVHDAASMQEALLKDGIETRRWYVPLLHRQPAFKNCDTIDYLTVAENLEDQLLGLPMHTFLSETDVLYVCNKIKQHLGVL